MNQLQVAALCITGAMIAAVLALLALRLEQAAAHLAAQKVAQ